ncbi:MAG: ABC transporter ATP-binding protein, partial [Clostridia bacterium]
MILEARALDFGFPGRTVGRDIGFSLDAGEVMCVLGPNGSGKTTLFRTLLGLLAPQSGEILIEGKPLGSLPRREIARLAGYVPQGQAAGFAWTVADFVAMGRTAHLGVFSSPGRADRDVAARALESL